MNILDSSLWTEVALVSILFLLGNIYLGHFEEKTPKWRKVLKYVLTLVLVCGLSLIFSRTVALIFLASTLIPVFYIHLIWLPSKGINGLTGEPREKYYELRGWKKDDSSKKDKLL
ncbi:hypothetical protein D0X99_15395 [Algoriphagus lacus]|uniref:Uncharacterized protein n=1 Tax=Algoriphagus lacus TaxID=2056311 RepID=A0A418PNX7_9BACT|nr:hypothetical protein [Algoriphagus lacus]RIW13627.1 hypothetical protein D0X99_15395 [Algoriphagus lacus]